MVIMHKLYIGTKDNSYDKVVKTLFKYFDGFTVTTGRGFWKSGNKLVTINSYIVDIIGEYDIEEKVIEIEGELKQDRILTIRNEWEKIR